MPVRIMEVFFKKITDNDGVFFLLVPFIDIRCSKILLESAMDKPVYIFTVFICSSFNNQSCFHLHKAQKELCFFALFCYLCNELPATKEFFYFPEHQPCRYIGCCITISL